MILPLFLIFENSYDQNWLNRDLLDLKSKYLEVFSESFHEIFLELYLMTGIKKWLKMTISDFQGKFVFGTKCGT